MKFKRQKRNSKRWWQTWRARAGAIFLIAVILTGIFSLSAKPPKVSAAIALVNKSTNTANTNNIVVNVPTGVASGNLMIAQIAYQGRSATITVPTGWTQIAGQVNNGNAYMNVYYRIAGASEPANYTWNFSRNETLAGGIAAFSGANKTQPIDNSATQTDTSSTTPGAPSVNLTSNGDMLVPMWTYNNQENASSFSAGLTDLLDAANTNLGVSEAYELMSTTGASGTTSSTVATATTASAFTIAIKPASAAAGISYVGSNSTTCTTGCTSVSVSTPTGWAVGDLFIVDVSTEGSSITAPAGWTQIDSTATNVNLLSANYYQADYYHIAASGDPSSYSWTFLSSSKTLLSIADFSGEDTSNPIDTSAQQNDASANSLDAPSVTTNYASDVLLDIWTYDYGLTSSTHTSTLNQVWNPTSGTKNSDIGVWSGYETLGNAGATGTRNTTTSRSIPAMTHSIALKPYTPTPTLINPLNSAVDQSLRPVFNLKNVSITSSPLKYVIYVCSNSSCGTVLYTYDQTSSQVGWSGQDQLGGTAYTGSNVIDNSTTAVFTPSTALAAGTQYWWQARSYDTSSGQYSLRSQIYTFTTSYPPAAPTLFSPPNGSNGISLTPEFQLATTDADGDILQYKLQLCGDSACATVLLTADETVSQSGWSGQDITSPIIAYGSDQISASNSTTAFYDYTGTPLTPNTTYYWRAYAIDPLGSNSWSPASSIYSFTANPTQVRILNGQIMSGTIE